MKVLYEIKEMLEDELKKICKQDALTGSDLDEMDKMVDIIKDIETIEAMKDYSSGYSGTGYSYADANMRGYSETWPVMARGRDNMGRYTSRDSSYGYSGHEGKDGIMEDLRNMMMNARSEEDREKYRKAIEQLSR